MSRIVLIAFILAFPISLFAQNRADTTKDMRICPPGSSYIPPPSPLIYIVVDSIEILIDNFDSLGIDPEHIKSMDVLKSSEALKKYDTEAGVVLIYPKKEYLQMYRKKYLENEN